MHLYAPYAAGIKPHDHSQTKYKIDFFTPTQIDSIPKDNRYNSMLHRKTLPGGKGVLFKGSDHKKSPYYQLNGNMKVPPLAQGNMAGTSTSTVSPQELSLAALNRLNTSPTSQNIHAGNQLLKHHRTEDYLKVP